MTDYDTLVKQYVQLADQKITIDEQLDGIKAELRKLDVGSHDIAGCKVTISPNRRIDPALVAQQYPVQKHPELWKASPDTTAIRKHLAPIRVEQLMTKSGEPKVLVR